MSAGYPVFAVVGHPNKGKSSIVATLAEDETVAIAPDPGTTRHARVFQMRADERVLYELIDTPGFQRPRATLAWLREHEGDAASRAAVLAEFLRVHADDPRFADECELLRPIVNGAGILYVVDGAHPYGSEYETEMEILRWTGQPRMALINRIGPDDHVNEWRRALDQYFSIARTFDAQRADFVERLSLLRSFRELCTAHPGWAGALDAAVGALERERAGRQRRAAAAIVDLLNEMLSARETTTLPENADEEPARAQLLEKLKTRVRRCEHESRRAVQDLYRHRALATQELEIDVLADDLFSRRSFAVFGLSSGQLAMTGAATGALAGGVIDLAVGGASMLLGAGVGALVGGVGALAGSLRLAKVQVLGMPLGGHRMTVGPVTSPNLPWVLLGRALLHHQLVAERNHSVRDALIVNAHASVHLTERIDPATRRRIAQSFKRIRDEAGIIGAARETLTDDIVESMRTIATQQSAGTHHAGPVTSA